MLLPSMEDDLRHGLSGIGDYIPVRDAEIVPDTTTTTWSPSLFLFRSYVLGNQSPFFTRLRLFVGV